MESTRDTPATQPGRAERQAAFECPQCGAPVDLPAYADAAVCAFCGSTLARQRATPDAPGGEKRSLRSVQCSQCAGPLSAFEGRRILVCDRCGVRVAVLAHDGLTRWHFPSRLTRLQAAEAGSRWLAEYPGLAEKTRTARLTDGHLVYAPIWEHRALVAGWEFGYKLVVKNEAMPRALPGMFGEEQTRLELLTVKEGVKEAHLQERRYFQTATDFAAFGASRPRISGRELMLPMLAGELEPEATVLQAGGDPQSVADDGRRLALMPLAGAHESDSHMFCLRESTSLLYYPMWVLLYQNGDHYAKIVLNGRDGSVNGAVASASNRMRMLSLAAQVAAAVVLVAIFIWLAATREQGRSSLVAAAVIVSLVAAVMVWRSKPVREVEYHEPFSS